MNYCRDTIPPDFIQRSSLLSARGVFLHHVTLPVLQKSPCMHFEIFSSSFQAQVNHVLPVRLLSCQSVRVAFFANENGPRSPEHVVGVLDAQNMVIQLLALDLVVGSAPL